jgi:hypothetical protein
MAYLPRELLVRDRRLHLGRNLLCNTPISISIISSAVHKRADAIGGLNEALWWKTKVAGKGLRPSLTSKVQSVTIFPTSFFATVM